MSYKLTSEGRVKFALEHGEPDRIPFDLAGTVMSGITLKVYRRLSDYLGVAQEEIPIADEIQQLAEVSEQMLERLRVDTRSLTVGAPGDDERTTTEDANYLYFY